MVAEFSCCTLKACGGVAEATAVRTCFSEGADWKGGQGGASLRKESKRQVVNSTGLAAKAKAREAQQRADLSATESKRRDALRSEAAMPITLKDYNNK